MKNSAILVALASVIAFLAFINPFNFEEREAMILTGVMKFMDQVHYNPKIINDDTIANYFKFTQKEKDAIKTFHKKKYNFFI